jgi:hypothetical protein
LDERASRRRFDSHRVKLPRTLSLGIIFGLLAGPAAVGETALTALKALPKEAAGKVLRIEAENGQPEPEKWLVTVKDPKAEFGLREYVVQSGEVVANAEATPPPRPMDLNAVIGRSVKIDSDKVTALAMDYALANGVVVSSMNHELQKSTAKRPAEWRLTCFGEDGAKAGTLVFSSSKPVLISQIGFPLAPAPAKKTSTPKTKFKPLSQEIVATGATPETAAPVADSDATAEPEAVAEEVGSSPEAESVEAPAAGENSPHRVVANSTSTKRSKASRGSRVKRSSPANGIRRVTSPVRRIIRRVLPF